MAAVHQTQSGVRRIRSSQAEATGNGRDLIHIGISIPPGRQAASNTNTHHLLKDNSPLPFLLYCLCGKCSKIKYDFHWKYQYLLYIQAQFTILPRKNTQQSSAQSGGCKQKCNWILYSPGLGQALKVRRTKTI